MTTCYSQSAVYPYAVNNDASGNTAEVTVWFDGDCPLCVREISLMRRLDRRRAIEFVDVTGGQGCPIDQQRLLERFHAREQDGELVSGAAAFAAMWRAIPLLRPLGLAAQWQPMQQLLEMLYLQFLRIRPRLQRALGGSERSLS